MPLPTLSETLGSARGIVAAGGNASLLADELNAENKAAQQQQQAANLAFRQQQEQQRQIEREQSLQQREQATAAKQAEQERKQSQRAEIAKAEFTKSTIGPLMTDAQRTKAESEVAKAMKSVRGVAAGTLTDATAKDPNANKTTGGFLGFGAKPTPEAQAVAERAQRAADPTLLNDEDLAQARALNPAPFDELDTKRAALDADAERRNKHQAATQQLARAKAIAAGVPEDELPTFGADNQQQPDVYQVAAQQGVLDRDTADITAHSAKLQRLDGDIQALRAKREELGQMLQRGVTGPQAIALHAQWRAMQTDEAARLAMLKDEESALKAKQRAFEAKRSMHQEQVAGLGAPARFTNDAPPTIAPEAARQAAKPVTDAQGAVVAHETSQPDSLEALAKSGSKAFWLDPSRSTAPTPDVREASTKAANDSVGVLTKFNEERAAAHRDTVRQLADRVRRGELSQEEARAEEDGALAAYERAHESDLVAASQKLDNALRDFQEGRIDSDSLNTVFHAAGSAKSGVEAFKERLGELQKHQDASSKLVEIIVGDGSASDDPGLNGRALALANEVAQLKAEGSYGLAKDKQAELAQLRATHADKLRAELTKMGIDAGAHNAIIANAELQATSKVRPGVAANVAAKGGVGAWAAEKLPFVGGVIEAARLLPYAETASKLERGETPSKEELDQLNEFVRFSNQNPTFAAQAVEGLASLPGFAIELALTEGIANTVKLAGMKGLTTALKKMATSEGRELMSKALVKVAEKQGATNLGKRLVSGLAQEAVRLPIASAGRVAEKYMHDAATQGVTLTPDETNLVATIDRTTPNARRGNVARIADAVADTFIENLSERSGRWLGYAMPTAAKEALTKMAAPVKERLFKTALVRSLVSANPGVPVSTLSRVLAKANIGSTLSEMGEERVGDLARDLWKGVSTGQWGITVPTTEQLASEFVTFLVPGAKSALDVTRHFGKLDSQLQASDAQGVQHIAMLSKPDAAAKHLSEALGSEVSAEEVKTARDLIGNVAGVDSISDIDRVVESLMQRSDEALQSGDLERASKFRMMALEQSRSRARAADMDMVKAVAAVRQIQDIRRQADTAQQHAAALAGDMSEARLAGEPINQGALEEQQVALQSAQALRAQADRASALIKIARGRDNMLTAQEQRALGDVVEYGPQGSIITDAARDELRQIAPAAADYIRQSETQRREELATATAQTTPQQGDAGAGTGKAAGIAPDSAGDTAEGVVSDGTTEAAPAAGEPKPGVNHGRGESFDADQWRSNALALTAKMPDEAARQHAVATIGAAHGVLRSYGKIFEGGVEFASSGAPGGLSFDPDRKALAINLKALALNTRGLQGQELAEFLDDRLNHEVIHVAADSVLTKEQVANAWKRLGKHDAGKRLMREVERAYFAAYEARNEKPPAWNNYQAGHELIRMMVQDKAFAHRISEAVAVDKGLLADLRDFLLKIADWLNMRIAALPRGDRATLEAHRDNVIVALRSLGVLPQVEGDQAGENVMIPEATQEETSETPKTQGTPAVAATQADTKADKKRAKPAKSNAAQGGENVMVSNDTETPTGKLEAVLKKLLSNKEAAKPAKSNAAQGGENVMVSNDTETPTGKLEAVLKKLLSNKEAAKPAKSNAAQGDQSEGGVVSASGTSAGSTASSSFGAVADAEPTIKQPEATSNEIGQGRDNAPGEEVVYQAPEEEAPATPPAPKATKPKAERRKKIMEAINPPDEARNGSKASDATKDKARKAFEGLGATERPTIEQTGLPRDRRAAFMDLADSLIEDGITEPAELAAFLEDIRPDGTLRKYSQALWNYLGTVSPELSGTHDWSAIYAATEAKADATTSQSPETGETAQEPTRAQEEDRPQATDASTSPVDQADEGFIDKATRAYSQIHQDRIRKDFAKPGRDQTTLQASLDEWSAERLRPRVASFIQEIADKDIAKLDQKNNGMWPAFWRIFALQTGIKVPSTQKGIDEMLKNYVGAEAYDAYKQATAKARAEFQSAEREKEKARQLAWAKADAAKINLNGEGSGKGDEWVESRIQEGWRVLNVSDTPIPRYQFVSLDGRTYKATTGFKPLLDYGRKLQEGLPKPESPPEENKSGLPEISEADAAHLFGKTPVDQAAHEAATSPLNDRAEPTQAQKEAGNYKLGHLDISGLDISVENPAGSERKGTDKGGKAWSVTMADHYGYVKGTESRDGDHIDIFVEPGTPENYDGPVFVVNQMRVSNEEREWSEKEIRDSILANEKRIQSAKDEGLNAPDTAIVLAAWKQKLSDLLNPEFDEHKAVLGPSITTAEQARAEYLKNYSPGWKGAGDVVKFDSVAAFKAWATERQRRGAVRQETADQYQQAVKATTITGWTMAMPVMQKPVARPALRPNTTTDDTAGSQQNQSEVTPDRTGVAGSDAADEGNAAVLAGEPPADMGPAVEERADSSLSARDGADDTGSREGTAKPKKPRRSNASADGSVGRPDDAGSGGNAADASSAGIAPAPEQQPDRGNYVLANPDAIVGGGPKTRFERNRKAIELYQDLKSSNRAPTAEELDTLAGYMGWGSFGQELWQGNWKRPQPAKGWEREDEWLRNHLGQEEWESAQRSIINAHYTDPPTVQAMWSILRKMGFTGGRVLEPSMGIGNFFGLMPADMAQNSQLTGVELDSLTGGMAQMLYPKANVRVMGYQDSKTADNFYDVVIGNWPFFEQGPADRRYDKIGATLHDYFFIKALDQVRPGGIVIGITSAGTMDKKGARARAEMAKRADLLASFRLPTGAFQQYAGTKVVTDIVILQKREKPAESSDVESAGWLNLAKVQTPGGEVEVNEYYAAHPDHILGRLNFGHGTTIYRAGMIVDRPDDLLERLQRLPEMLPDGAAMREQSGLRDQSSYITNNTSDRQNAVTEQDGKLFVVNGEHLKPLADVVKYAVKDARKTAKREDQVRRLVGIRRALGAVLDAQRKGSENTEKLRADLREQYQSFIKNSGAKSINDSDGLGIIERANDPFAPALAGLEYLDGKTWKPREIFERNVMRGKATRENPTIADAYAMARNESLTIDLDEIAKLAKTSRAQVEGELVMGGMVFKTPVGTYEPADVYLSGNVRQKLREAKEAQAEGVTGMERNISALADVVPSDIPYFQIEANAGASWVTAADYEDFVRHLLNSDAGDVTVARVPNGWKIIANTERVMHKAEATQTWGVPQMKWRKLFSALMNNATVRITYRDEDGVTQTNEKATEEANGKIDAMRDEFKRWLWSDPERTVRLEAAYNEVFNAIAIPKYDGSHLAFEGLVLARGDREFNLRSHQANAVWRGILTGRGLYAHEVGTGKTLVMAAMAMEARRLGKAKKPLILAHNANARQVAAEIQGAYPGAKILFVDNLNAATRQATLNQIALDDWDCVVMPHSIIDRLCLRPESVEQLVKDEIAELEQAAIEAAEEDDAELTVADMDDDQALRRLRSPTAKELVKEREKLKTMIEKSRQLADKPDSVFFEDLGVDMLTVDEAHIFKKLPVSTKQKLKGLNKAGSKRGIILNLLTQHVKRTNGGQGVHLFTGTPITNTLNEVFNMMRYMMDDVMKRDQVDRWDSWFNTFADSTSEVELNSAGEWESVERLAAFVNLPELRRMVGQYLDIVFADDMPEFKPRSNREGRTEDAIGRPFKQVLNVISPMTYAQKRHKEHLSERYQTWKKMTGKQRVQAMRRGAPEVPIIIEGEGVKAAIDMRLIDRDLPAAPEGKIGRMIDNVVKHYGEHNKATQMVFMQTGFSDFAERSTGQKTADGKPIKVRVPVFNVAKDIKRQLIERGIPEEHIAIFSDLDDEERKIAAERMQRGEIRVAIGSTETMGTGVNAQNEMRAMHHLDAPWMPGDLEQRNGRGWRQGNRWNTVLEYRYITEGSHDGRRWQILLTKDRFIKRFMKADDSMRVIEGDGVQLDDEGGGGFEETFSAAAGDPRILQREKLNKDVNKLLDKQRRHFQAIDQAKGTVKGLLNKIERAELRLPKLEADKAAFEQRKGDPFLIKLGKKTFDDREEADNALLDAIDTIPPDGADHHIGSYRGFALVVSTRAMSNGGAAYHSFTLRGQLDHSFSSKSTASMDYALRSIGDKIEREQREIGEARTSIASLEKMANTPFGQQADLERKQEMLADIVKDLEANPNPAPAWLRNGAPVGTSAWVDGAEYGVVGHKANAQGFQIMLEANDGTIRTVDYTELRNDTGLPVFTKQDAEQKEEAPEPDKPAIPRQPRIDTTRLLDVDSVTRGRWRAREKLRAMLDRIDKQLAELPQRLGITPEREEELEQKYNRQKKGITDELARVEAALLADEKAGKNSGLSATERPGLYADPEFAAAMEELTTPGESPFIPLSDAARDLVRDTAGAKYGPDFTAEEAAQVAMNLNGGITSAYQDQRERETHAGWIASAAKILETDGLDSVARELLADPARLSFNPVKVKLAQMAADQLAQRALLQRSPADRETAERLLWAYNVTGTQAGRAVAARDHVHASTEEMHRRAITNMLFTPPAHKRAAIERAISLKEKNARIAELERQLGEVRAKAAENERGILGRAGELVADVRDEAEKARAAANAQVAALNKQIAELRAQKDQSQLLAEANQARIAAIEADLARDFGLTLHDLFVSREALVRLRGSAIVKNALAGFNQKEALAQRLRMEGKSDRQIQKQTGISEKALADVFARVDEALTKQLEPWLDRGFSLGDFEQLDDQGNRIDPATIIDDKGNLLGATLRAKITTEEKAARLKSILGAINSTTEARNTGALKRTARFGDGNNGFGFDLNRPEHAAMVARAIQRTDGNASDMIYEYWINGLLSGPATQTANIAGNTASMALEFAIQRPLEAMINATIFRDAAGAQLGEFRSMAKYASMIFATAVNRAKRAWQTEISTFDAERLDQPLVIRGGGSKNESEQFVIGGTPGRVIRTPSRLLNFADEFAKYLIGGLEAAAQAHRLAKANGLTGEEFDKFVASQVNTNGSQAWLAAVDKAHRLTFTSELPDMLKKANDMLRDRATTPGGAALKFFLRMVFPFVRTPYNIFATGLRKTPLGTLRMAGKATAGLVDSWKGTRPFFDSYPKAALAGDMAEQLVGWVAALVLAGMAEGDPDDERKHILITGTRSQNDSRGEAQLLNRTRGGETTILINGKPVFNYGRIEPFATVISTLVDAIREWKKVAGGEPPAKAIENATRALADQARSKTFLQGFDGLMQLIDGRTRSLPDAAVKAIVTGAVPNLVRQPLRNVDGFARDTRNAPWYYQALPLASLAEPLYDLYGRPIQKDFSPLSRIALGSATTKVQPVQPADRALERWNKTHEGDPQQQYNPVHPSVFRFKDAQGKWQQMRPDVIARFRRDAGRAFAADAIAQFAAPTSPTAEEIRGLRSIKDRSYDTTKKDMLGAGVQPPKPVKPMPTLADLFGQRLR